MSEQELWNELGNLYFLSGSYDQAANAYERSIQLETGFGRPYSNLALTFVQQGKFDEAIELYRRSIELLTENKERAVSWNRLGTVYRHLKDYSKAVIAFQEADELDPQSMSEFPAAAASHQDHALVPSSILNEPAELPATAEPEPKTEPQVEWWDADEKHSDAATQSAVASIPADEPPQTWTTADPSEFQQDVSEAPQTVSLTTWQDTEVEDELELISALDLQPDVEPPDPDDDISTWLPIPEEEPWSAEEVPPFYEGVISDPPEPEFDWNNVSTFHVVETVDFAPVLAPIVPAPAAMVAGIEDFEAVSQLAASNQQAWKPLETEVAVEERTALELAIPVEPASETVTDVTAVLHQSQPEMTPIPADAAPETNRDVEEMREIELGIEKFKRVVQVNPRNGHAWDALGTLYKSAGQYKEAILAYQQAISNDPSRSLYYHHLGLVYACEGRDEDAIGAFQRVIEIDPDYSLAHATLGGYYRKMGFEELAQKHIGKAMKNIFDSENEYNRACLEAICGNADQAIELLGVALKNKQTYVDWILRDPDLDFIRQDPRFKQLISDYTR
jgi:tetratricopeptide (TPR) repeat protein